MWTKRELIEDNEDLFELLGDICSYLEESRVRLPIELCERIEEFLGPSDGLEDLASGDVIDVTPVDRSRAN